MKNLEKNYAPNLFEEKIYKFWADNDYFKAENDKEKESYTIIMPPPNVTGKLHIGHALNGTMQDIMIRYKRMQGYCALWLPGTDHASIATEAKVVEKIKAEGKTKEELGREGFLKEAWAWTYKYGGDIKEQFKKLGASCDWSRDTFTLDKDVSQAVLETFENLYKKGYIYRGKRIVNWCPNCHTAVSDIEVVHEPQKGKMWHIKYPLSDGSSFVEIATTRPETMLGDLAVAVNPSDERYKDLVGKTVKLPLSDREIPIISDFYVDKEFGTGCVKITPSHDPNDFEVGERHNLGHLTVIDKDAKMNENAGKYKGMDRYEARKEIIKDLDEKGFLVKEEIRENSVGHCERCNTVVEPLISDQWFVKMNDMAKKALEVYKNGELNIYPERFGKIYENWLLNIRDWCISRQLWWGHRLPVYYCLDCGNIMVSKNEIKECDKCKSKNTVQDSDTLDTWFSSALWPFTTLGWPDIENEDYKYFYPTDLLITGYDILTFWVLRMVFSALEQTGKVPFKDVLLTGLVRDSSGRKMSKTLGNGVDPIEVIDNYGADALRYSLINGISPGNDSRFDFKKVEAARNFANKLWNAARFLLMNLGERENYDFSFDKLEKEDKWILGKLNKTVEYINKNLDNYEIGLAAQKVHDFIWEDYCDWYIELIKTRFYNNDENTENFALYIFIQLLKLLHPFMPFISEEIYSYLPHNEKALIVSKWPESNKDFSFMEEEEIEYIMTAIRAVRKMKQDMNIEKSKKFSMYVYSEYEDIKNLYLASGRYFNDLEHIEKIEILKNKNQIDDSFISIVIDKAELFFPLSELIDFSKEIERLENELSKMNFEVERLEKKLSNSDFINKAPQKVVDTEKDKLESYRDIKNNIEKRLSELRK